MSDFLSAQEGLTRLSDLRTQIDQALTTPELRAIHSHISRTLERLQGVRLDEIADALNFELEKNRKGTRLRIYRALRQTRPDLLTPPQVHPELQQQIDELGESGVYLEKSEKVIVPTNKKREVNMQGTGSSEIEKQIHERLLLTKDVLISLGVDLFECSFIYGKVEYSMIRQTPYVLVIIPQFNRMILVCDEADNRTFVINGTDNQQKYIEMNKDELKDDELVRSFIWTSDTDKWKLRLVELLKSTFEEEEILVEKKPVPPEEPAVENEVVGMEMTAEYFTQDRVKKDLEAYVVASGKKVTIETLSTSTIHQVRARCCNGEEITGGTYMKRAGLALGIIEKRPGAPLKSREVLNTLKRIAGYEIEEEIEYSEMNAAYFRPENIKADLLAFAKKLGEDKTPMDLNTTNMRKISIVCQNSETLDGRKYFIRYARAFGLAKKTKEISGMRRYILDRLLLAAGYEVYAKMTREYFTPENVKADLQAYAKAVGVEVAEMSSNIIWTKEALCQNGETVLGVTYLQRVASVFESEKLTDAYNTLLQIAGYEVFDEMGTEYFTPKNIRADLQAYAKELGDDCVPLDITTGKKQLSAQCQNGETITLSVYLSRAGMALGMANTDREANSMSRAILDELLDRAGYIRMSVDYYTKENVKADLLAFAATLGKNKTPHDINTNNISGNDIRCSNCELLNGSRYLTRAAMLFGLAKTAKEAMSVKKQVLNMLMEIAGYDVIEDMDIAYFTPENVRADLKKYAQKAGVPLKELNTGNMGQKKVRCGNGEIVKGVLYLDRAGKALGIARTVNEAQSMRKIIIRSLLVMIGCEIDEYEEMTAEYFTPSNVSADLETIQIQIGEGSTLGGLNSKNIREYNIKCSNGEEIQVRTYFRRASIALGLLETGKNVEVKLEVVLAKLLEIAESEFK